MIRLKNPVIPAQSLQQRLEHLGYAAHVEVIDIPPEAGGGIEYIVTGSRPTHEILEEEHRAEVEAVLAETSTRRQDMARIRTLREKPVLTTPELTEAVKLLLLKYVEEEG